MGKEVCLSPLEPFPASTLHRRQIKELSACSAKTIMELKGKPFEYGRSCKKMDVRALIARGIEIKLSPAVVSGVALLRHSQTDSDILDG